MLRISRRLFRRARQIDPLLPLLLRATSDLPSAQDELRWLREHVANSNRRIRDGRHAQKKGQSRLEQLCRRRSTGEPLQYVLGTEFFGDLELRCRPGVLIPRYTRALPVMGSPRALRRRC